MIEKEDTFDPTQEMQELKETLKKLKQDYRCLV